MNKMEHPSHWVTKFWVGCQSPSQSILFRIINNTNNMCFTWVGKKLPQKLNENTQGQEYSKPHYSQCTLHSLTASRSSLVFWCVATVVAKIHSWPLVLVFCYPMSFTGLSCMPFFLHSSSFLLRQLGKWSFHNLVNHRSEMRSMYLPLYLVSSLLFSSMVHNVKYNLLAQLRKTIYPRHTFGNMENYINFALSSQMASEVWTYHCSFNSSDECYVVEMQNVI